MSFIIRIFVESNNHTLEKPEKILEISLDNSVRHTRYWTMNNPGVDSVFFEGTSSNIFDQHLKRLTPLAEAKQWARQNGYTQMTVVAIRRGKSDKTYSL